MTILYIVDEDLDKISGVANKVITQVQAWEKEGHKVLLLSIFTLAFFNSEGVRLTEDKIRRKSSGKFSFLINAYKSSILLKALIKDIEFDIVYMRYKIYDPFFKSAVKNKPLIAEMNTVLETETKLRSYILYAYYIFFKKISFSTIDGFVCVSNEIKMKTLNKRYKSIVIANEIDVKKFLFTNQKFKTIRRPKLVFIGSPGQIWQGFDKVVYMAKKLTSCDFHIIGQDGVNTANLFYHGYLPLREAMSILQNSDIGICTLALHRKSMNEASPLKSRQYLALGLPIIYAYDDTDITNNVAFALKLKNEENNIKNNINNINNFIYKVFNNENIQSQANEFAKSVLDVEKKEQKRLEFMKKILLEKGDL